MELLTKASLSGDVTQREKENLQIAYEAACEAMVLLKNEGALPFTTKKIAVYGPGASMTIKGGTGSGEVNERFSISIWEGMEHHTLSPHIALSISSTCLSLRHLLL